MQQTTSSAIPQPQTLQAFFSVLQTHYPDFVEGYEAGKEAFYDEFEAGIPLSSGEIQEEIDAILSVRNCTEFVKDIQQHGHTTNFPHLWLLGLVLGQIEQGYC